MLRVIDVMKVTRQPLCRIYQLWDSERGPQAAIQPVISAGKNSKYASKTILKIKVKIKIFRNKHMPRQ